MVYHEPYCSLRSWRNRRHSILGNLGVCRILLAVIAVVTGTTVSSLSIVDSSSSPSKKRLLRMYDRVVAVTFSLSHPLHWRTFLHIKATATDRVTFGLATLISGDWCRSCVCFSWSSSCSLSTTTSSSFEPSILQRYHMTVIDVRFVSFRFGCEQVWAVRVRLVL